MHVRRKDQSVEFGIVGSVRQKAASRVPFRSASLPMAARLAVLFVMVVLFCPFLTGPAAAADAVTYWNPWVTNLTTTSATVNWLGSETATGSVQYATASHYNAHGTFQKTVLSDKTSDYQHVSLTGLDPNTSYMYQALPSDKADAFGVRAFKTMPVSGPFSFIVLSDTHAQLGMFKYVADAITANETDPLFILDGGDYASWDHAPYWQIYFQDGDGMLAKFPLFHTIGNHEYHNFQDPKGQATKAVNYHKAFDVPEGGALNYAFDCSGVRFVVLNSPDPTKCDGDDPQVSLRLARSQASWLAQQLDNTLSGTFTIHHHPVWTWDVAGSNPALAPWEALYQSSRISASFAGHVHNYQRYSVNGIPYFVVGNGGGKFTDLSKDRPRHRWFQYGETRELGYLKVTVDPENNTATAQEIFVAHVAADDTTATAHAPIVVDVVTFPLSSTLSTLSVTKSGMGSGVITSSDSSINCGSTCQASYKKTGKLTFTPAPDAGSVFAGWTGACSGSGRCVVPLTLHSDITMGAVFDKASCAYSLSPGTRNISSRGSDITIGITGKDYSYCRPPEIVNNTGWVTQTAMSFSNNRGSVTFSIPQNSGSSARTGTVTIGGATLTINQNRNGR
jgi:acid phosphatase type 7